MKRKPDPRKDLRDVSRKLNDSEYAKKVGQNVQLKRQETKIKMQIARVEAELEKAKAPKRAKILKILKGLRKAAELHKTTFFKK